MFAVQNNKQLMYDFYENVLNKRNWEMLAHFVSQDFENASGQKGINAFIEPIRSFMDAFPDLQWKVKEIVAEEDTVMVCWGLEGTHINPFRGFGPTGKRISIDGMGVLEFKGGKIVSARVLTDRLGLLQQINIIPVDLSSLRKKEDEKTINFIDKFFVPVIAIQSFQERMKINREFIKTLPGFMGDEVYKRFDENGNLTCLTIAKWAGEEALRKGKEAVQEEYKKQNFIPQKMFEELDITLERSNYKKEY